MGLENSTSSLDTTMVKQHAMTSVIENGKKTLSQLQGRISTNASKIGLIGVLSMPLTEAVSQTNQNNSIAKNNQKKVQNYIAPETKDTTQVVLQGGLKDSVEKKAPDPKVVAEILDLAKKSIEFDRNNSQKYIDEEKVYPTDLQAKIIIRGKLTATISKKLTEYIDIYLNNGIFNQDEQQFLLKLDKTVQKIVDEKLNWYEDQEANYYQQSIKLLLNIFQSSEITKK